MSFFVCKILVYFQVSIVHILSDFFAEETQRSANANVGLRLKIDETGSLTWRPTQQLATHEKVNIIILASLTNRVFSKANIILLAPLTNRVFKGKFNLISLSQKIEYFNHGEYVGLSKIFVIQVMSC